jgi:ubiquinone biosynthesis protein
MSCAFSEFNEEPIAAASLGQIHHAVMRKGREVVVKIQRPGIRELTIEDLEALADIANFYDKHTKLGKRYEFSLLEIDGAPLAKEIFKAYLKQILVDGFFHADPHPGNVFVTDDNKIALIDLGMVAYLTPHLEEQIFQLLLALAENRPDTAADICKEIGTPKDKFDEAEFRKELVDIVHAHLESDLKNMSLGRVVLGVTTAAGKCAIRVPPELTMLGKTLLNLDQVGRTLYPEFDVTQSVKDNAAEILEMRMEKSVSAEHVFRAAIDAKNYAEKLPGTMMKILDLTANNKLRVQVDAIDEAVILDAFQKVANRITLGLVLAALIIGASLLMRVETKFTIFGYPGLAIICFIAAASAGFALVINIGLYDRKAPDYDDE